MSMTVSLSEARPFQRLELAKEMLFSAISSQRATRPAELTPLEMIAAPRYAEIEVELDPSQDAVWCWMHPVGAPSFTPGLLRDLSAHQHAIRQAFDATPAGAPAPVKHAIFASRLPGIYNLGGDLDLFAGLDPGPGPSRAPRLRQGLHRTFCTRT